MMCFGLACPQEIVAQPRQSPRWTHLFAGAIFAPPY
jgi:hypothetical protein